MAAINPFLGISLTEEARLYCLQEHSDSEVMALLLGSLRDAARVPGFSLPSYDYVALTYYGSTNNLHTATYKTGGSGGVTVATLTVAYVGGGAADDDNVSSVTKT